MPSVAGQFYVERDWSPPAPRRPGSRCSIRRCEANRSHFKAIVLRELVGTNSHQRGAAVSRSATAVRTTNARLSTPRICIVAPISREWPGTLSAFACALAGTSSVRSQ